MSELDSNVDVTDEQDGRKLCFIISAPRSGSTWITKALSHHPDVFCVENRFFGEYYDVVPNADGTETLRITLDEYVKTLSKYYSFRDLDLNSTQFQRVMESALVNSSLELAHSFSNKMAVIDKITPYRNTADTVLKKVTGHFPEATIVQLVRDGRDVMTSGVFDWIARTNKDHPRYSVFVEKKPGIVVQRFFSDDDIDQWTDEWAQPIRALASLPKVPITIRYESMKHDQAGELKKFLDEMSLCSSEETIRQCIDGSTFEKMSGGRKAGDGKSTAKARKGVTGDWKNYFTRRDGELFLEKTGTLLVDMGYEIDDSWIDTLPNSLHLTPDSTIDEGVDSVLLDEPTIEIVTLPKETGKPHSGLVVIFRKVFRHLTGFNLDIYHHQFPELKENMVQMGEQYELLESYVNKIENMVFATSKRLTKTEGRIANVLERLSVVEESSVATSKEVTGLKSEVNEAKKRLRKNEEHISVEQTNQRNNNERLLALGNRAGILEKRFTDTEKRFANIGERFDVFEKRHHYIDSRIGSVEKLLESVDTNPRAMWVYANRVERMDATLPFFDEKRRAFHLARYHFSRKYIKGMSIADMACGTGYGSALLSEEGGATHVTGVDIDVQAIEYAQEIHSNKKVTYLCASVDATGIPEDSLDGVVSFETIEHIDDDRGLVEEFARILKPGGVLICSTPNQWPLEQAPYHTREYNLKSFRAVLEKRFSIIQIFNQNSGSESIFNHEQQAGIIETTVENENLAECYIAVCELK